MTNPLMDLNQPEPLRTHTHTHSKYPHTAEVFKQPYLQLYLSWRCAAERHVKGDDGLLQEEAAWIWHNIQTNSHLVNSISFHPQRIHHLFLHFILFLAANNCTVSQTP